MKHLKHLLFLSTLCSLVLFTNCIEDEEPETTPITTGLSENQDLLIGNWLVDDEGMVEALLDVDIQVLYSFYSNNSFRVTATSNYEGENVEEVFEGSYSFDEADLSGMTLKLELFDPDFPNQEPIADPFRIISISNKRMSAIEGKEEYFVIENEIETIVTDELMPGASKLEFIKQ